jgi:hypothetical protein
MMTMDGHITPPTKFDAGLVAKTSKLIKGFPPLPNADLIAAVVEQQQVEVSNRTQQPSTQKDPTNVDTTSQGTTANPAVNNSGKFGPPTAIPGTYHITSGTQVNTDPTITTAGVTNIGKIYRSLAQDGPFPNWLGTTQSAFDSVNAFDSSNPNGGFQPDNNGNALPLAGFLFSALQLDGDPTISIPNGVKVVGFASQGGIMSSASGTTLTFSGINEVALIALNGSIDLSNVSLANFGRLFIYARGAGSNLTLGGAAAQISNVNRIEARAEGDIQINGPVSVNGTAQDQRGFKALAGNNIVVNASVTSVGGILLQSLGGITLNNTSQLHSMLDSMGNGGQVIVIASGSDTPINVSGTIQADSGGSGNQSEVDIRQTGVAGSTSLSNATLHADVIKVSALGNNGTLNIGSGNMLNANTIIKLYAGGSNGTLNFLSSVTINSPTPIFAANTISISQGAIVTVNTPGGAQATVYTNNPNYFGSGGKAASPATAGTFGGAGAKNPAPLINAPPLGAPGQGP